MSIATVPTSKGKTKATMPLVAQVGATIARTLRVSLRNPFPLVVPLLISLFFSLFTRDSSLRQRAFSWKGKTTWVSSCRSPS